DHKDEQGSSAWAPTGPVQQAARALKAAFPALVVVTDVCLCEYTSHGHCGPLHGNEVDNDAALPLLARTALSHVEAGADIVAPSDMMDGRVAAIRRALDENDHRQAIVLSYAVKYASAFYGPFREAAGSAPSHGDRRGYQMDPPNAREALREAALDEAEGADALMVKPGLPYLDIVAAVRAQSRLPLAVYHVSGEYAMLRAAASQGWLEYRRAARESLIAMKRAGADLIVTYTTPDVLEWMANGQ
ncbi:MAG TPA: porphobilinogen synthase, partial [Limnochordia bacterium]|nr:porphobilinogen synthase [Limnochordia bacterium]